MNTESFLKIEENEIQQLLLAVVAGIADDDQRASLFALALTNDDLRRQLALSLPPLTEDADIQEVIDQYTLS